MVSFRVLSRKNDREYCFVLELVPLRGEKKISSVAAVQSCFCFIIVAAAIVLGIGALFLLFVLLYSQRVASQSCETLGELLHHPKKIKPRPQSRILVPLRGYFPKFRTITPPPPPPPVLFIYESPSGRVSIASL